MAYWKTARIHIALDCWHTCMLSFKGYEFLQDSALDTSEFDVYCANIWNLEGAEAEELAPASSESDGSSTPPA